MPKPYDHYKLVPALPVKITEKKKKPKLVALVDEDNCTGCQVCVPFCPVDCIEPVAKEKYNIPIPPVQIRFNECIGCSICARVCTKLTWDAIEMLPTARFEAEQKIQLTDDKTPAYGVPTA
jgi:Pyruvate/2-oxoacid:ferredoxin oxidoreductase delta subunit